MEKWRENNVKKIISNLDQFKKVLVSKIDLLGKELIDDFLNSDDLDMEKI